VTASAFDPAGHDVIEALAYRSLVEGRDGHPARPEVLRDLINDGALVPPICFGKGEDRERLCRDASDENPLLLWPQPLSDRPDQDFRRQFTDAGQCFHYMGLLGDEDSPLLKGRHIPRALATSAVVRCNDLLDHLLRQVVIVGGVSTRDSGQGLYQLMHAVTDSFSYAHTQRESGSHAIDFLRVWESTGAMAANRLGAYYSQSPVRHDANDPRDRAYIQSFVEVAGRACRDLTDVPYTIPFACLSEEGDLARRALVDLLVVVRGLRQAQLNHLDDGVGGVPERSPAWLAFKTQWFRPAHACEGAECQTQQPGEVVPASDLQFGVLSTFNPTRGAVDVEARVALLRSSPELSPFIYAFEAEAGYRRLYKASSNLGLVGVRLTLKLPFGPRSALGITPIGWRLAFGGDNGGSDVFTQLVRYDFLFTDSLSVSVFGPVEVDWRRGALDWSFGLALGYQPARTRIPGGPLIRPREERSERQDDTWAPEPLWYGRLKGREWSWYAFADTTLTNPPEGDTGGATGLGALGASVMWDRDPSGRATGCRSRPACEARARALDTSPARSPSRGAGTCCPGWGCPSSSPGWRVVFGSETSRS
jgi:hypothetical protein